jgi:hypothetical protein
VGALIVDEGDGVAIGDDGSLEYRLKAARLDVEGAPDDK